MDLRPERLEAEGNWEEDGQPTLSFFEIGIMERPSGNCRNAVATIFVCLVLLTVELSQLCTVVIRCEIRRNHCTFLVAFVAADGYSR